MHGGRLMKRMLRLRMLPALVATLAAGLLGCRNPTDSSSCRAGGDLRLAVDREGSVDWRAAALAWTDTLMDASSVELIFRGLTYADSGVVSPYGGTIAYSFHFFPAAFVRIPAGGLRAMASDSIADPGKKITGVEFGAERAPACE
jgi:hypothetical protein